MPVRFRPVDFVVINTATPAWATLAHRSDGRIVTEIRNSINPKDTMRKFYMTTKFTGHVLFNLGDLDNNGVVDLGVAAQRNSDGRWRMEIKNARGIVNNTRNYWISP